ncbi:MAG: DUF1064 domain-containing protein [Bacteroidales bacterium]
MNPYFSKIYSKSGKYKNKKTEYNGFLFDSKKEADYCCILDLLQKAIKDSDRVISYEKQVPFQIILNDKKICKYYADFKVVYGDGRIEIVDVKGFKTDIYRLKKKLVEAQYGINIIEI